MGFELCRTCGEKFEPSGNRRLECFRCHVKGVNLGFTYGKADFHGPTIRERQRQQEAQAAAGGIKAEPVGNRWV